MMSGGGEVPAGFIYRNTDDTPADEARARWATEVVPAVRAAITR